MIFNWKDQDPYIEKDHDLDLDLPRSPIWSWSGKIRWTMIFDLDLQDHFNFNNFLVIFPNSDYIRAIVSKICYTYRDQGRERGIDALG